MLAERRGDLAGALHEQLDDQVLELREIDRPVVGTTRCSYVHAAGVDQGFGALLNTTKNAIATTPSAAPSRIPAEQPRLAILAAVGEIDPLGTRMAGLDAFLDQKVEEGYVIETRSDTQAIIFRRPKGLRRFTSGPDPGRYVVQVDEDGIATMRPAEPRRT